MNLIYPGPSESVTLPGCDVVAERGKAVDVPDEIAADLLAQGWTEPKKSTRKPRKTTAKKAAKSTTTTSEED